MVSFTTQLTTVVQNQPEPIHKIMGIAVSINLYVKTQVAGKL